MTTKQNILAFLEENKGLPLSGEMLATQLHVSRSAIWKAIKDLQKEGHAISAVTNKGYTLDTYSDRLSAEGIRPYLKTCAEIVVHDVIDSTNTQAKRLAAAGAPHGTLVVANSQTEGRGRRGRSFASPAETGLYLSLVLRSTLPMESAALVTSAAAVAVCRALKTVCDKEVQIKWVNDLYYHEKKCCGILSEASADFETGGVDYMVVGIGLNIHEPEGGFPAEIRTIATALFERGAHVPRCKLAAEIANEVLHLAEILPDCSFMEEYRARNLVPGREVTVLQNGTEYPAKALSITDSGHLIVQKPDGTTAEISFGEVSIRL